MCQKGGHSVGVSQRISNSVPILYGRLQTIRTGFFKWIIALKLSASTLNISNLSPYTSAISFKAGRHLESFSSTTTLRAPSVNRPRVKPPGPGPTSRISWPFKMPASRAIFAVKLRSSIKFCPKDLCASNL